MSTVQTKLQPLSRERQLLLSEPAAGPSTARDASASPAGIAWVASLAWNWSVRNASWLISAVLHVALAVFLTGFFISQQREHTQLNIEAVFRDDAFPPETFDTLLETALPKGTQDQPVVPTQQITSLPPEAVSPTEYAESGDLLGVSADTFGIRGTGPGGGTAKSGAGTGGPGGAGFFGTVGEGNSFVYIVDMSGSMQYEGRFRRATAELNRSILKLKPHQKFFVFFFNDESYPMFYPNSATEMVQATMSMKSKASRWIRSQRPNSMTDPTQAIEWALQLKPDVIFLLTDGAITADLDVRALIKEKNVNNIVFHTIAFVSKEGEQLLQDIAHDNRGTYRFVK